MPHPKFRERRAEVEDQTQRSRQRRLIVLAGLIALGLLGWAATQSALLDVDEVRIVGAERTSAAYLRNVAGVELGTPVLGLDTNTIEERLALYFGIRKVIWLREGLVGDKADGQVNKVARFVAPGRMMCAVASHRSDPNHGNLNDNLAQLADERDALGRPLELLELPLPTALQHQDGHLLTRSYLDFYLGTGAVYVPAFDDPADEAAARLIGDAFPKREVVQLDMAEIAHRGGAIHCMTQQQPKV